MKNAPPLRGHAMSASPHRYLVTPHRCDFGWPLGGPHAVTWHWTGTWDLATCRKVLGPGSRRSASVHYAVGRTAAEGIDEYVPLHYRSWHAEARQRTRWDGGPMASRHQSGRHTTIGVETVHIGHARPAVGEPAVPAGPDWLTVATPGGVVVKVQPWPTEQVVLMAELGREIVRRYPEIGVRDHHGHDDLCPGKVDVTAAFPWHLLLNAIYPDLDVPDVWSRFQRVEPRQEWLAEHGYYRAAIDGLWGPQSKAALRAFQRDMGLDTSGRWTTHVNWAVHDGPRRRRGDVDP